ncbi:MAG: type I-E CRISPR-associated endoribonuclease Cas2 [Clostridiales bacterium]|jgi:CRISPR-associated protein Cas2|nr:type I-E CRISPR-associated endoribonuclease Cas2 [Clostridiales bacterium]
MTVIVLTDCPPSLRGDLTKWLQEVNTNVFVGHLNARVRDQLWERILKNAKSGRVTMVFRANNEQRMDFRVHNTTWEPIDFDGLKLMLRPSPARLQRFGENKLGFSKAAKMQKAKRFSKMKQKSMYLPQKYIVLDLETTGLSLTHDEIIEIGALLVEEGQIKSKFHSLIKPKSPISSSIEKLTGIRNELLESEGKELSEVLSKLLEFASDLPVVSHNADFDLNFIRIACQRLGLPPFSNRFIDTLSLARRTIYDVKDYKLQTLLEYFNINVDGHHRSIKDCISTLKLYTKLIELQQKEN